MAKGRRVWRVRPWIRASSMVVVAVLVWLQLASPSWGVPPATVHDGWFWLSGMCALVLYLAWVPYVAVGPDDRWVMQGWTRRLTTTVDQYCGHAMNAFGLGFEFKDGRTFTSVVFQDTAVVLGEPRYFDFIEVLTGARPVPEPTAEEDD